MALTQRFLIALAAALPLGCTDGATIGETESGADTEAATADDDAGVDVPALRPPPIVGGTMLLSSNGNTLLIADPDRDLVLLVDPDTRTLRATTALEQGSRPFRGASGDGDELYVLTADGRIVSIDATSAAPRAATAVCSSARGIAYDAAEHAVWVSCARGYVESYDATSLAFRSRFSVADDLRDIHVDERGLVLSTFRHANVVWVTRDGVAQDIDRPFRVQDIPPGWGFDPRHTAVARRTTPRPSGGWFMLHQRGGVDVRLSGRSPVAPTKAAVTLATADGRQLSTGDLLESGLVVDAAINPTADTIVAVSASRTDQDNLMVIRREQLRDDREENPVRPEFHNIPGQLTSVAFEGDDRVWVYSREPAGLRRLDLDDGYRHTVDLDLPSVSDEVHDLFHLETPSRSSCATCHPEGGEDGLTWHIDGVGHRRTRTLRADLTQTTPYGWAAQADTVPELLRVGHGASKPLSELELELSDELTAWLGALPRPSPARAPDDPAVLRGRTAFEELGCDTCHGGAALTGNMPASLTGSEPRDVPSLRGVGARAPYMHNGRAQDLREAVLEMVDWADSENPTFGAVDDVVAYLESL